MRKIERLINLVSYLYSQKSPVSLEVVSNLVLGYEGKSKDALRQMFYRDKKELAKHGIEIDYIDSVPEEERGFIIDKEKRYLPKISFTPDEIAALKMLYTFLDKQDGYPFSDELFAALLKITLNFPDEEAAGEAPELDSNLNLFFDMKQRLSEEVSALVGSLEDAMERKKEVSFDYLAVSKSGYEKRTVYPYHLYSHEGSWYVTAYCLNHKHIRNYKLDRIKNLRITDSEGEERDFELPENFDPQKYAGRKPWDFESEKATEVKMHLSARIAPWARRFFKETKKEKEFGDGSVELLVSISNLSPFMGWALSMGTDVHVLAPESIRAAIREELDKMEGIYK